MSFGLKNLLWKAINKAGIARQVEAALVVEKAQAIVDEFLPKKESKLAKVLYLKNQLLTVACLSSTVAQEIKLNEPQIINRLNQQFNKEIVKRLRFLL
jgi:predicted nucleic acid-binding Zn ribbon protein